MSTYWEAFTALLPIFAVSALICFGGWLYALGTEPEPVETQEGDTDEQPQHLSQAA